MYNIFTVERFKIKYDPRYNMNKIIPIQEPIPVSTVRTENKLTKFILEGLGWTGSILVLCPYVVTFERDIDFILNTLGATGLLIVCIKSKQYLLR